METGVTEQVTPEASVMLNEPGDNRRLLVNVLVNQNILLLRKVHGCRNRVVSIEHCYPAVVEITCSTQTNMTMYN